MRDMTMSIGLFFDVFGVFGPHFIDIILQFDCLVEL